VVRAVDSTWRQLHCRGRSTVAGRPHHQSFRDRFVRSRDGDRPNASEGGNQFRQSPQPSGGSEREYLSLQHTRDAIRNPDCRGVPIWCADEHAPVNIRSAAADAEPLPTVTGLPDEESTCVSRISIKLTIWKMLQGAQATPATLKSSRHWSSEKSSVCGYKRSAIRFVPNSYWTDSFPSSGIRSAAISDRLSRLPEVLLDGRVPFVEHRSYAEVLCSPNRGAKHLNQALLIAS
jgi:hypothetical protein